MVPHNKKEDLLMKKKSFISRMAIFILIAALCMVLAGCSEEKTPPPAYKPPAFSSDAIDIVFRAPDGVPFYYGGNFPEDFNAMLVFNWEYPTPFYDSSEEAKQVCAYFQEHGVTEDIPKLLEKAKASYSESEDYKPYRFSQIVRLTAETDSLWAFDTEYTVPYADSYTHANRSDFFDPSTGKALELWDLFSASKEEVTDRIISFGVKYYDEARMEEYFDPTFVAFFHDKINVIYGPGTLSEPCAGYSIEYSELADILHPWANPKNDNL